jgi:serine/threonine protein kinase
MLFCMLYYKFPFNGDTPAQVEDRIKHYEVKFPKETPTTEEFIDLVKGMLIKDPSKRYNLYTIKTHKWMLLSDSAISLKSDLAKQSYQRELQKH